MKKLFVLVLFISAFMAGSVSASDITLKVNDEVITLDQAPIIEDGRTLVPVRFVSEALGAEIEWDGVNRKVFIETKNIRIELAIDSDQALVNNQAVMLDVPAKIVNDRTLVPVRFVAENLNTGVFWETDTRTVLIYSRNDDSIFTSLDPWERNSSWYAFEADTNNQIMRFKEDNDDTNLRELSEDYNPNINQQVYSAAKALLDDRHYTHISHSDSEEYTNRAFVTYSRGELFHHNGSDMFKFIFYEDESLTEEGNEIFLYFVLGRLWTEFTPGQWVVHYYEHKLKSAFIGVFGEQEGTKIHDYVVSEYVNARTNQAEYRNISKTIEFDSVFVEFYMLDGSPLNFLFSYK